MLNITLVIQGLNFLFAYWLLSRFFFKPVLLKIKQDEEKEAFLKNLILKSRGLLEDGQRKSNVLWQNMHKKIVKYTGFCSQIDIKQKALDNGISELDMPDKIDAKTVEKLTEKLIDKISSV